MTPAAGLVLAQGGPAPDVVRQTVADVLSQPEYDAATGGSSILDRILQAIAEAIGQLLLRVDGDGGPGSVLASLALVAVVVALVVAVVVAIRRLRRGAALAPVLEGPVGRPAADWAAEALAHEQAGRHAEAIRCRYRQAIAHLAAAGLVDEVPGRTTGEYRGAVATALPVAREPFEEMTDVFDATWYGGRPVDGEAATAFAERTRAVIAAVPGRRRVPA